jgi:transcriptional regulator with XRE-family HTH domain
MKLTREELLQSPEYWFENAQNDLYGQVTAYMEKEGINQNQLAERLGVTKGYVSQILKGEFNYTLKKLIDLSLAIGQVPKIEYSSVSKVIEEDRTSSFFNLPSDRVSYYPLVEEIQSKSKVAEAGEDYFSTYKVA